MRILLAAALLLSSQAGAADLTWSYAADVLTLDPHTSNNSFTNAFAGNSLGQAFLRDLKRKKPH